MAHFLVGKTYGSEEGVAWGRACGLRRRCGGTRCRGGIWVVLRHLYVDVVRTHYPSVGGIPHREKYVRNGITLLLVAGFAVRILRHGLIKGTIELSFSADVGADTLIVSGDELDPVHGTVLEQGNVPILGAHGAVRHNWEFSGELILDARNEDVLLANMEFLRTGSHSGSVQCFEY